MQRIAVFGLGYVGAVSAAVFARDGYDVIGVDPNVTKLEMIDSGRSPVIETGLDDLIREGVDGGRLWVTTDADEAVSASDVSMICVGTPSNGNGSLDHTQIQKVCQEIGLALSVKRDYHVVAIRSTMLPGTTEEVVIPTLEAASGKRAGEDFGVCVNPEFLREGTSIHDFHHPPFTLIGSDDDAAATVVSSLYDDVQAELVVAPLRVAEMVKYACNAFHAMKVTFANEVGAVCHEHGIDSHAVMDILCKDTKLNVSRAYLRPGFAFGGSCLPKDLRALVYQARHDDVEVPVLEAILRSNAAQIDRALRAIASTGSKRVGVLGLAFKAGTDDLRESPMVELIERLVGKGYEVCVFDRNVSLANLQGTNRAYIEREIPHIASLMTETIDEVAARADVVVIGNADPEFAQVADLVRPEQVVIDLVRIDDRRSAPEGGYRGLSW